MHEAIVASEFDAGLFDLDATCRGGADDCDCFGESVVAVAVCVVEVPSWLGSGAAGDAERRLVLGEEPSSPIPAAGRFSGCWAAAQHLVDGVGLFEAGDSRSGA